MAINFKEEVARVRELLKKIGFTTEIPAATETQAADAQAAYATESGAIVKIDKLEPGGMIYDADGVSPITTDVVLQDGTIVANDGAGMITAVTLPATGVVPEAVPVIAGPEGVYAAAMKAAAQKFAAGTPEERLANLEAMSGAVMQYCFGWKIEEAARKAIEEQALAAYKTLGIPAQFSEQFSSKTELTELNTKLKESESREQKFKEALEQVVSLVEKFAAQPSDEPAQKPQGAVTTDATTKSQRREALIKNIAERRAVKA